MPIPYARLVDATPNVANATDRDARFPTPALYQKVFRIDTDVVELWTGAAWVTAIDGGSGALLFSGTGSPEGSVTAGVGATYQQTDGANGAVLWAKVSGTGNTGWKSLNATALSRLLRGTGSPEGVVTADISALYEQEDGAGGTVLWAKNSGSGNTGWKPLQHALGWYDVTQYGIVADGATDQTTELTTLFGQAPFSDAEFGGVVFVPYKTKFDYEAVTAALPIGAQLLDFSSINYHFTGTRSGVGTGYKNKVWAFGEAGRANDDQLFVVRSGHNAVLVLQNLGTAEDSPGVPSASATARLMSFGYAVARLAAGDPLYAFVQTIRKSTSSPDRWVHRLRTASTYAGFVADPETAATDATIIEIDEYGQVCYGTAVVDGTALRVVQSPVRNGGVDVITSMRLENTNTSSEVLFVFACKNSGGTTRTKRLRMQTSGDDLGQLEWRNNANAQVWAMDDDGSIREYGGKRESVNVLTAASTVLDKAYRNIVFDATSNNVAATLPSAASHTGRRYTFVRRDSSANTATITGTVSGVANPTLAQYEAVTVISDGTNWLTVG